MELWELRQKPHLSASSINQYIECSLNYKFAKIDKIPAVYNHDALEFGSAIHFALEEYYHEKKYGNILSLKDIHESFEEYWTNHAMNNEDIQYTKNNTFDSLLLMGKEMLTVWYNKKADDNYKVVSIEEAFEFKPDGLEVPIIGAWDMLEEDESGSLIITDFKTSGRAYSIGEVDNNFQMTIYSMAAKANGYKDREIILKFDCLLKTKNPRFEQYYTIRSERDEKRALRKIQDVWNGIKSGVFIANDGSWKCGNCVYKTQCDEYLGGKS